MKWESKKFVDFIFLQRGHDLTKKQIKLGIYPVVSSTSIIGYHNTYKAQGPGVIIGRSGTIGEVQYIKKNYWPHNTSLYVKDFKGNNPRYVFYFLINFGTDRAKSGSAIPTLNRNNLSNIKINIPDINTQNKIADILSAYDDLIENNKKQIKLLEEMAQKLYEEWFVNLRFPGHENTKIINGIPEGWEETTIDSFVKLQSGYAFKSSSFVDKGKYKIVTIKNVQDSQFNGATVNTISQIPSNMPQHCRLYDGDILLSLTGNVGRICIVYGDNYLLNQRVAKLYSNYQCFVYCLFKSSKMYNNMNNLANGVAQQNLSPIRTGQIEIVKPNNVLIDKFESITYSFFSKIICLNKNISLAQQSRDYLLPKLMSGELEV